MSQPIYYCTVESLYGKPSNYVSICTNSQLLTAVQQYQQFMQQSSVLLKLTVTHNHNNINSDVYVSWNGNVFQPAVQSSLSVLGVPVELQHCLYIPSHQRMAVSIVSSNKPAENIEVRPVSMNDYEVIQSNTDDIELNLLTQLNIINICKIDGRYCKFPYYVRNKQLIYLQPVVRDDDKGTQHTSTRYVRLGQSSEVSVVPLIRNTKHTNINNSLNTQDIPPSMKLRVQPIDNDTAELLMDRYIYLTRYSLDKLLLQPNSLVLLTYKHINSTTDESHTYNTVVRVQYSPLVAHNHVILNNTIQIELRCNCFEYITIRGVHNTTVQQFDKSIGTIMLQPIQCTNNHVAVDNDNYNSSESIDGDNVLSAWNNYLSLSKHSLPVFHRSIIHLDGFNTLFCISIDANGDDNTNAVEHKHVFVKALPQYYLLSANDARTKKPLVPPSFTTLPYVIDYVDSTVIDNKCRLDMIGGMNDTIQQCQQHLDLLLNPILVKQRINTFKQFHINTGGLVITGGTGTGKTLLCHSLAQYYRTNNDIYAAPLLLSGNTLAAINKTSTIITQLQSTFRSAVSHSPSLIIIDDIDSLVPASTGEQDNDSNALRSICISEVLNDLLLSLKVKYSKYSVTVIITQKSTTSTHSTLQLSQLLSLHITLKTPNTDQRSDILYKLFARYNIELDKSLDMSRIALKCSDGMTCIDLLHIVDRSIHNATVRYLQSHRNIQSTSNAVLNNVPFNDGSHIDTDFSQYMYNSIKYNQSNQLTNNKLLIKSIDIDKSLIGYTPSHLSQLNLSKQTTVTFNDIGALIDVKHILKDTIELPSKYSRLFNNIPIKLRSGLLLYGPPGCGKTMIATAVANEININLISVKGPELLNKYIGASEQAVRDVFIRARAASPCILLFDEFESIAPKRGGDSTGVTDRVVNQFLCELDGVESRGSGIYILACSSRPDMIDPALLRPGRIDKTLYCPLPNKHDRFDILHTITQNIELCDDVDLQYIANLTENYSSADLHAIVTTAQINILHQLIDEQKHIDTQLITNNNKPPHHSSTTELSVPPLNHTALMDALNSSAPSLNNKQRQMYDSVYSKFIESKQAQPTADTFDPDAKMKTSFA